MFYRRFWCQTEEVEGPLIDMDGSRRRRREAGHDWITICDSVVMGEGTRLVEDDSGVVEGE